MAGVGLVRGLCEEATCPICLDYFKDPVMIPECGHNLCRGCLDRCCGSATEGTCPQCRLTFRRGNIGPNRQLATMVEIARKLSLRGAEGKKGLCEQHGESKKLFCRDDKTLICVTCEHKDHRGHETLLLEEAHLTALENVLLSVCLMQGEITAEREKTVRAFRQLCQFLDEQERCLLTQMDDAVKQLERVTKGQLEKFAKELQSLERIIQDVEKKLQQPATDLLQVRPGPEVTEGLFALYTIEHLDTAHPQLTVSPDSKSVRHIEMPQKVPDNPERFDYWTCVLGHEEFTAGRHFWEVYLRCREEWAVGVARKSVKRKGKGTWEAKEGIWCMGKWAGEYIQSDRTTVLPLHEEPRKIRVTLNCEGGRLAIYDADRRTLICEFSTAPFTTEKLHPYFLLTSKGQLSLFCADGMAGHLPILREVSMMCLSSVALCFLGQPLHL
uniref:Zinc finger protein RFP-like n=1 Tax=Salvator merianae TaxID=96440 RepID=A0A8D0C4M7_SALMN